MCPWKAQMWPDVSTCKDNTAVIEQQYLRAILENPHTAIISLEVMLWYWMWIELNFILALYKTSICTGQELGNGAHIICNVTFCCSDWNWHRWPDFPHEKTALS